MEIVKEDEWKDMVLTIQKFALSYASTDSKQPVNDGYTRGYYTAVFMMLEASPNLWGMLSKDTQGILNKAKRLIDDHYHLTDSLWPPANKTAKQVAAQG